MDSIFLTGPLGTSWNVGSWIEKDAGGIDYGAAGLIRQQLTQTTFVEGAQLAYESAAGARRMSFPLIVPSGGIAGLSLDAIEASLRQMVRPGGFVDMQPQGVPTAEMVRFDVLGGDVAHRDYSIDLQRVSRRRYTLSLQTQPFGYWPTWITLASVASMAFPGTLQLGASRAGDVPGFVEILIVPTVLPSVAGAVVGGLNASWYPDLVGFAFTGSWLAAGASQPIQPGNVFTTVSAGGASFADSFCPVGSNAAVFAGAHHPYAANFMLLSEIAAPASAADYRVWLWTKLTPSGVAPLKIVADWVAYAGYLASGNPVATAPPNLASSTSNTGAYGPVPSNGFVLCDLGVISVPTAADLHDNNGSFLRIWTQGSLAASAVATPALELGAVMLQPVANAGILLGLQSIDQNGPVVGAGVAINSRTRTVKAVTASGTGSYVAVGDLTARYRGGYPLLGATITRLDVFTGERLVGAGTATAPVVRAGPEFGSASVVYRPRFAFSKGI